MCFPVGVLSNSEDTPRGKFSDGERRLRGKLEQAKLYNPQGIRRLTGCRKREALADRLGERQNMEQERRRMPRVPFVASAELLEVDTGTRMNAQVSELSLHGCYVDSLNPLPKGTSVYVKIFTEEYFFETPAIVVYCHPHLGMGLAFHDVKPHFVGVLQNWLMASAAKKTDGA